MKNKEIGFVTLPELAKILGISRIAVFKKVKSGKIKAIRIGRNYAVSREYVDAILGKTLSEVDQDEIDSAVKKTVNEYGQTLKLLGKE